MLIRLIPQTPHPNVLFTLSFPDLPASLTLPLSWDRQVQALLFDNLELPRLVHSLDKAAAFPTLLNEVTFDVPALTVSCEFVDGNKEEWPLMEKGCLEKLEMVVKDVVESAEEDTDNETRDYGRQEQQDIEEKNLLPIVAPPPAKAIRHKKQRSLLMSLVASLVPSASSSAPARVPLPPARPATPTPKLKPSLPSLPAEPPLSPRALRRRARSTLVDTFRLHILPELTSRSHPTGTYDYHTWITKSMLRRAEGHLAVMLKDACVDGEPGREVETGRGEWDLPSTFFDDEEGSDDTDGSSLQTPSPSSTLHTPTLPPSHSTPCKLPSSYGPLRELASRLHKLLSETNSNTAREMGLDRERHLGMEVRARRKAWSNGVRICGAARSSCNSRWGGGFSVPYMRSRLGMSVWGPEDIVELEEEADVSLLESRQLFPVSEEDEEHVGCEQAEDEILLTREMELEIGLGLDMDLDLESGLGRGGLEVEVDVEKPVTPLRPRVRTQSMSLPPASRGRPPLVREREFDTSILCQPLTIQKPVLALLKPEFDAEAEFTLAMDLPFSVRVGDMGGARVGAGRGRRKVDYGCEGSWLAPGVPVVAGSHQ